MTLFAGALVALGITFNPVFAQTAPPDLPPPVVAPPTVPVPVFPPVTDPTLIPILVPDATDPSVPDPAAPAAPVAEECNGIDDDKDGVPDYLEKGADGKENLCPEYALAFARFQVVDGNKNPHGGKGEKFDGAMNRFLKNIELCREELDLDADESTESVVIGEYSAKSGCGFSCSDEAKQAEKDGWFFIPDRSWTKDADQIATYKFQFEVRRTQGQQAAKLRELGATVEEQGIEIDTNTASIELHTTAIDTLAGMVGNVVDRLDGFDRPLLDEHGNQRMDAGGNPITVHVDGVYERLNAGEVKDGQQDNRLDRLEENDKKQEVKVGGLRTDLNKLDRQTNGTWINDGTEDKPKWRLTKSGLVHNMPVLDVQVFGGVRIQRPHQVNLSNDTNYTVRAMVQEEFGFRVNTGKRVKGGSVALQIRLAGVTSEIEIAPDETVRTSGALLNLGFRRTYDLNNKGLYLGLLGVGGLSYVGGTPRDPASVSLDAAGGLEFGYQWDRLGLWLSGEGGLDIGGSEANTSTPSVGGYGRFSSGGSLRF